MMKKILLLFTVLLLTAGGGQLWAAPAPVNVVFENDNDVTITDGQAAYTGGSSLFTLSFGEKTSEQNWQLQSSNYGSYTKKLLIMTDNSDYFVFTPSKNGTLVVAYNINSGKTFVIEKNSFGSANYAYNAGSSSSGNCTTPEVEVTAGTTYYVRGLGTKAGYYGFTFTPEAIPVYSGSYPFTWDFTKWETTSADLSADTNWNSGETAVSYKTTTDLTTGASLKLGSGDLPETKGLLFKSVNGSNYATPQRIVAVPDNYFDIYVTDIFVPSLKSGYKVTFVTNQTSNADIKVDNTSITRTTEGSHYIYTYTVPSSVTTPTAIPFSIVGDSSNHMQILSISVEKADFAFSEHHTQYWDGTTSTNTKSGTYKAGTTHFNVRANVPAGATISSSDFKVTSSSDAIDVSSLGYSFTNLASGEIWFNNLVVNKSGVAELTFTFRGNDDYNPASFTVLVNVVKGNIPYFEYTNYDKNKDERAFSPSPINKTMKYETSADRLPPFGDVTFTSSNTEVATVNSSTGEITFVKPGISVITATFAGNDRYYGAETYFTLVVTGTENTGTINWTTMTNNSPSTPPLPSDGKITLKLGDHAIEYPATSSLGGEVKYMSTDKDIVTVNASTGAIEAKHPGVAYIYAYQEGSEGQSWIYKDYKVQVNGGSISIGFEPGSATITKDRILMPRLSIPSLEKADITSLTLTVESGGESYVSVSPNLLLDEFLEMQGYTIAKVHPRITGLAATSSPVKVTAHFVSPYYNNGAELTADFYVTVTNNTGNFSWATSKTEFTIVEGEFMMMPSITGNANGNIDGLSKGSVNAARQGYVYEIKGSNRSITYNTEDYYYGQGVPDYTLTPAAVNGGEAYIYWIKGMDDSHPALMIYGESAGDLTLTATDSQTGYSPGNITIHVVSKDKRVKENETTFWNSNKFPFTWDFTNIAPADITDDEVHWKTKYYGTVSSNAMDLVKDADSGCHLLGMASSFDYNYSDEQDTDNLIAKNSNGKDPQAIAKYICNGEGSDCKVMPAFHGIRIALGNNSQGRFHHKRDKVRIHDTTTDDPRLYLEGGKHYLYLPAVGSSKTPGTAYKLFMKVKGHAYKEGDAGNSSHVDVHVLSADSGDPSTTAIANEYVITKDEVSVIGFDIPAEHAGKAIRLGFDKNVDIYWIAYSTEAKNVVCPKSTNSKLTYASASYSYNEDLDLSKSGEVNEGVTAYYASSYTFNKDAEATGTEGYAVVLTPITTKVPANTGLILKKNSIVASTSCYMIANGKNVDSYSSPDALATNYLKATPTSGGTISSTVTTDQTYTNFTMAYAYKMYHDPTDAGTAYTGYLFDRDWSFYRIMDDVSFSGQKSYLQIPGNLYVNRDGEIVEAGSRRAASDNRPSTKAMLDIIYEDEPLNDSGTTGISIVNDHNAFNNDGWYTLQGVRVNVPSKGGIYIHHGKKVVVK